MCHTHTCRAVGDKPLRRRSAPGNHQQPARWRTSHCAVNYSTVVELMGKSRLLMLGSVNCVF